MTSKTLIFLVLIMMLFACSKTPSPTSLETLFSKKPSIDIDCEPEESSLFFGQPVEMVIIDSLLIVKDAYANNYFSVINLQNLKLIKRFGVHGNGPDEIMYPSNLTTNHEKVLGFTTKNPTTYLELNIYHLINSTAPTFQNTISVEDEIQWPFDLIFFGGIGNYIAKGMFTNGKYGIINKDGHIEKTFGTVPEKYENTIENRLLNSGYQGYIQPHPKGDKIVHLSAVCDLIDIIDADLNIQRFQTYDPELKEKMGMVGSSSSSPYGFTSLGVTEEYIFGLYSGRNFKDHGGYARFGNKVYVLDWKLKPICALNFETEVASIAVDVNTNKLYYLTLIEDEIKLCSWEITL